MFSALSVDLGTTALKAVLADEIGRTLASASETYNTFGEREGFAEQDPNAWWEAFARACQRLQQAESAAFNEMEFISFCGQMHTHVYLDAGGRPLRTAITWMDQRSADIVARYAGDERISTLIKQESANAITTTYTAPNIEWIKRYDQKTWAGTRHILVAKDYVKYLLTGEMMTDYSEAAGTLLFNVGAQKWSSELLDLFGVSDSMLPEVAPAATIMGHVTEAASEELGLRKGVPVVNGATDNSTAALGAGVTEGGEAAVIVGTAGVVSVCSDTHKPDPNDAVVCWNYALPDRWINLGVMQTAGESLNWFRRAFDADTVEDDRDIFSVYNEIVGSVPDGSEGLIFLPYLNGERTPYWDSDARGVFFGAGLGTRKAHFVKAIMEGVAMALRNNAETVEALGQSIDEMRAIGGGLHSRPWLEILSRVLEKRIRLIESVEPPVRGNVALGRVALTQIGDPAEVVKSEYDTGAMEPPGNHGYDEPYKLFLNLYRQLQPLFKQRSQTYKVW